jgi:hypothetical protein
MFNATENFKRYTLRALPTLIEKIAYISSLQSESGGYAHWGMNRVFGQQRAQKAIGTVHLELAVQLVRVPIRGIYEEYRSAADRKGGSELLAGQPLTLGAPSNGDELLSAHLRLIQESIASVDAQESTVRQAA